MRSFFRRHFPKRFWVTSLVLFGVFYCVLSLTPFVGFLAVIQACVVFVSGPDSHFPGIAEVLCGVGIASNVILGVVAMLIAKVSWVVIDRRRKRLEKVQESPQGSLSSSDQPGQHVSRSDGE